MDLGVAPDPLSEKFDCISRVPKKRPYLIKSTSKLWSTSRAESAMARLHPRRLPEGHSASDRDGTTGSNATSFTPDADT
jgi:hypothetical protein